MSEKRINNWGRWGAEDQRGTLNLLTPDAINRGVQAATRGRVYSLALPLNRDLPRTPTRNPMWHVANSRGRLGPGGRGTADDLVMLHTHYGTHLDALCHVWYDGKFYNGFSPDSVSLQGAQKLSIENVSSIVGHGVLLDIAAFRKVDHLESGQPIFPDELDACARAEGVTLRLGDILLIHTGWLKIFPHLPDVYQWGEPGPTAEVADWFGEKDLVAMGADNWAVEAVPPQDPKGGLKVHQRVLRDYGGYLMENLRLEELARDQVYEFLFVVAPLRITMGLGSPINPLAIV